MKNGIVPRKTSPIDALVPHRLDDIERHADRRADQRDLAHQHEKTPNQTGSMPAATISGKTSGTVPTIIGSVSKKMPRMHVEGEQASRSA